MNRYMESRPDRKRPGPVVTGSRTEYFPDDDEEENLPEEFPDEEAAPDRKRSTRLLTVIQISVCIVVLVSAVAVRMSGGTLYQSVRTWYFTALQDSILPDSQAKDIKRRVVDLWSAISSSRSENGAGVSSQESQGEAASQSAPSGAQKNDAASQNQQSGVQNHNGAAASQPNNGASAQGENQAQPNAQSVPSVSENGAGAPAGSSVP